MYLHRVTVANLPENYEDRLVELFRGTYRAIRLFALDPYDIALSKIDRNSQVDRDDVKHLVKTVSLSSDSEATIRAGNCGQGSWATWSERI